MTRRMVKTTVGWVEIASSDDQRFASLSRMDDTGWLSVVSEWDEWESELFTAIEGLGMLLVRVA